MSSQWRQAEVVEIRCISRSRGQYKSREYFEHIKQASIAPHHMSLTMGMESRNTRRGYGIPVCHRPRLVELPQPWADSDGDRYQGFQ
ncbi:hypothetical protein EVAR_5496_1 [Eumeta japonica]|uniref:Uncharacterized protein n=1 Tax=Eumeta variegata TaxID=151549 RepID=A0A4C1T8S7_EUMVA|nr:hypothetical protein EVAR_5496_1 [Eumeta japonica]